MISNLRNKKAAIEIEYLIGFILGIIAIAVLIFMFVSNTQEQGKTIENLDDKTDCDGDGIPNLVDQFPCDKNNQNPDKACPSDCQS